MDCSHEKTREIEITGYSCSVSRDENRAAHGGVCVSEECVRCGARRRRNVNGRHVEIGAWGEPRSVRGRAVAQAEAAVRAMIASRPNPARLRSSTGGTAHVSIDRAGYLCVNGDESALDAVPALVAYARELRLAVLHAEQLRDEV